MGRAVGRVVKSVAKAAKAVAHFVVNLFRCIGTITSMVAVGYCKKFPVTLPPIPSPNRGVGLSLTASRVHGLGEMLAGKAPSVGVAVKISAVIGAIPGTPFSGGVRAGSGMGVSFSCVQGKTCNVGLSAGYVVSALVPTRREKTCVAGGWFKGFRCMVAAGVSISTICCNLDVVTGKTNCR